MHVNVVIATNGDGYVFHNGRIPPGLSTPEDSSAWATYVSRNHWTPWSVGCPSGQVIFLSYPTRHRSLLVKNWSRSNPFISPYSEPVKARTGSPTIRNRSTPVRFPGRFEIRHRVYQPDLILYPHPDDVHADHWGLSAFTRLAVGMLEREDGGYRPDTTPTWFTGATIRSQRHTSPSGNYYRQTFV